VTCSMLRDLTMGALEVRVGLKLGEGLVLLILFYEPVKHRNKKAWHLVLFCDFLGLVFIQWESTSTSDVLLLELRTLSR
jgi:hypothetical protein